MLNNTGMNTSSLGSELFARIEFRNGINESKNKSMAKALTTQCQIKVGGAILNSLTLL